MSKKWTYLEAAEEVLRQSSQPLSTRELTEEIEKRGLIRFAGRTPWKTLGSKISVDIKKKGGGSPFKRIAPGVYALRAEPLEEYVAPESFPEHPLVLVFRSELLARSGLGCFHGVNRDYHPYVSALLEHDPASPNTRFMIREQAEESPDYKQIVSYVMVKHGSTLLRHIRGGERSTLGRYFYDAYSISFGGHVEWTDRKLWGWQSSDFGYGNSVVREMNEEIGITIDRWSETAPIVGVINDQSTDLGRKHFAFVHLLELSAPEITKTERTIRAPQWIEISDLHKDFAKYEYWSRLCIQTFFADQQEVTCHVVPRAVGSETLFSLRGEADFVLIVGHIGSGKTMACTLLARHFGYQLIRGSHVLKSLLGYEPDEDVPREELQEKGLTFVSEPDGHDRLAQGIMEYIAAHPSERYVLDGLRYPESLDALRARLNRSIAVIYIESPTSTLLEYYRSRERRDIARGDFLRLAFHPVELETSRFYDIAHVTIYNHGALESYVRTLLRFFHAELR